MYTTKYVYTMLLLFLMCSAHLQAFVQRFCENFHTVEKGKLYRSGQLKPNRLEHYLKKYTIKTVINLRGRNPLEPWWLNEFFTTQRLGVTLHDIAMNSYTLPPKKHLIKLLHLYKSEPKPILIHCLSGADRTGEAAALWVLEQQKKNKRIAQQQLSLRYGYLKRRKPAKYLLIKIWQNLTWLIKKYKPESYPNFCH